MAKGEADVTVNLSKTEPKFSPRRNSTGSLLDMQSREAKAVPHYLLRSQGSCHDLCKFGFKHDNIDTFDMHKRKKSIGATKPPFHSSSKKAISATNPSPSKPKPWKPFSNDQLLSRRRFSEIIIPNRSEDFELNPLARAGSQNLSDIKVANDVEITKVLKKKVPVSMAGTSKSPPKVVVNDVGNAKVVKKNVQEPVVRSSKSPAKVDNDVGNAKVVKKNVQEPVVRSSKSPPKVDNDVGNAKVVKKNIQEPVARSSKSPPKVVNDVGNAKKVKKLVQELVARSKKSPPKVVKKNAPVSVARSTKSPPKVVNVVLKKNVPEPVARFTKSPPKVVNDVIVKKKIPVPVAGSTKSPPKRVFKNQNIHMKAKTKQGNDQLAVEKTIYCIEPEVKTESQVENSLSPSYKETDSQILMLRRGKELDSQSEENLARKLKFREREDLGEYQREEIGSEEISLRKVEIEESGNLNEDGSKYNEANLRHQDVEEKDSQDLLNNVIEETASKLVGTVKGRVLALIGAFETVISRQDSTPLQPPRR